ncbi:MAG: YbaB/EbfC family nucleoid-associated protein [Firmicutes bacterium]|nr:YbaB/EbfC family nucleoid-associated protein [Bacillota bacterium]
MKGKNFGGNAQMQQMMRQAEEMKKQLDRAKEDLAETLIESSSGGGMVTVEMSGAYELLNIKIKPEAVDPDDVEMMEDLVIAAINEALSQVTKLRDETLPL